MSMDVGMSENRLSSL